MFFESCFELISCGTDVDEAGRSEEVEVLRRSSREAGCEQCPAAGQEESARSGKRQEQTGDLGLEFGQVAHGTTPSMTGCHASRISRGRTRSVHNSTSSAPSMQRWTSTGMPSRRVISYSALVGGGRGGARPWPGWVTCGRVRRRRVGLSPVSKPGYPSTHAHLLLGFDPGS